MLSRLAVLLVAALTAVALLVPGTSFAEKPAKPPPAPPINWDLKRLSKEPLKLIKARPEFQRNEVRFLIEFTRPPTPSESFDWEHKGLMVFRFYDEDGVSLGAIQPRWEGEFVRKAGARLWLVLPLPEGKVIDRTASIVAEE
jgi:hypothetical protein